MRSCNEVAILQIIMILGYMNDLIEISKEFV